MFINILLYWEVVLQDNHSKLPIKFDILLILTPMSKVNSHMLKQLQECSKKPTMKKDYKLATSLQVGIPMKDLKFIV